MQNVTTLLLLTGISPPSTGTSNGFEPSTYSFSLITSPVDCREDCSVSEKLVLPLPLRTVFTGSVGVGFEKVRQLHRKKVLRIKTIKIAIPPRRWRIGIQEVDNKRRKKK